MSKNPIVAAVCLLSLSLFPAPSSAQTVTFTDARDGKQYKSVKMPDGKTWFAENLRYKSDGGVCVFKLDNERDDACIVRDVGGAVCTGC
jgi:hypothetical protein